MDSTGVYKKDGKLGGARHGDAYQVHVLMLLSERAGSDGYGQYKDFRLATEIEAAGKFDDAVLSRQHENGSWNWLFVQVKHKQNPGNLEERDLFPVNRKGDFSIYKYLEAFWNIKHGGEFVGKKQFILFTNCGLAKRVQDWFTDGRDEIESILTLETNGEQFIKLIPTEERCQKLLAVNSDFNELTEIVRSTIIDGKDVEPSRLGLLKAYRSAIVNKILVAEKGWVRFAPRFIMNKNLFHAEHVLRRKLFPEDATLEQLKSYCVHNTDLYDSLEKSKKDSPHKLPVFVERAEIQEFLNSLIFAVNQPDNAGLNMAITNDLKSRHKPSVQGPNAGDNYASLAYCKLQRKIYECLDATEGVAIRKPDLENIIRDVEKTMESPIMNFPTILFREKMLNFRVKFDDPIPPIPEIYPAAILTSNSLLTCLKVFQNMPEESFYYFTLKDLESKFIRGKLCEALGEQKTNFYLLIKDDNCPQFKFASEILEAVGSGNLIKLILLTDCEESASNFFNEHTYTPVREEDITLDQLTVSSQKIFMKKAVLFQGSDLKLSELADVTILGQVLKNETLEKLLLDETVTIGPTLPELGVKQYISRRITSTQNLLGVSPTYDEEQFLDLDPAVLRKVVVLSSSAGMGKTMLWKKLARLTKSRFQTEWVFYLKLHECEEHFNSGTNLDVADFLIQLFRLPQLDAVLLRRKLEDHERVYVFCDGFDELPVKSMESAIDMIRVLQDSTLVLVNTRTSLLMKLQEAFNVDAFYLVSIDPYDQTFLFKCLCDISDADVNSTLSEFMDRLLIQMLNKTVQQSSIDYLGVPMMVTMLAEIYKPNIDEYQKTKDPKELEIDWDDLNIVQLFEKYVYSYFRRHTNLSIANRNTQRMFDPNNYLYKGFVKLHCYLGLKNLVQDQHIIRDKQKLQELEEQFQLLDSPIVDQVSNQSTKPIFIHLSIAEFFAAKCLFEYLKRMETAQLNVSRMSQMECDLQCMIDQYYQILRDHPIVRNFFFLFAQYHKDCLPKCELLLWCMRHNTEIVLWAFEGNFEELAKRLLQEDSNLNVNIEGKNSETLLHMAAGTGRCEVARLLIARGANVDATTSGNTPLHYAAMSGHLDVVELLAKKGCDLNKLNYRNFNALHCAAFNEHTDVVRFLGEEGVQLYDGFFGTQFKPFTNYALTKFNMIPLQLIRDKKYDDLTKLLWTYNNEIGQGIARNFPQLFEILPIFRKRTL